MDPVFITRRMLDEDGTDRRIMEIFDAAFMGGLVTWEEILEHQFFASTWMLGWLAAYSSWVTPEISEAFIERSDTPDYWREEAEAFAPLGQSRTNRSLRYGHPVRSIKS